MDKIKDAVQLFEDGYRCSQAVFAAFSPDFGVSKDDALKIGACFGSGMRKAEVCGACTGALMVLGLRYGDNKSESDRACEEFLDEFKDVNGSYICRDLLNCDISTEEGVEYALDNNLFKQFCPRMVESAAEILEKIIH
ncbi:C_GCAxxG_C_C family protein [Methanobrevibacter sp. YE315]|uniref:C-GCAxxG-C-C family protein n=1 Tax=Methanobrevibacter sp. YE315 TaxID=1609968 RepID=UPI000764D6EF|nr:C-GCAxxG-C-C family protein [Methanobrevibacter sp. YE315]AMD17133.1 C_GCAxxG_C_C family protein [Methanobrevibacter sp. YE315]